MERAKEKRSAPRVGVLGFLAVCVIVLVGLLAGCGEAISQTSTTAATPSTTAATPSTTEETATQQVVDLAGRTVTVPAEPSRVAPLVGPGYEKIILLGAVDKVVITGNKMATSGWSTVVAPGYASIPVVEDATQPNIEELAQRDAQVVFYWDSYPDVIEKLGQVGIPVVVTQLGNSNPTTADDFTEFQKNEVKLFGQVLGGDAVQKAQAWCDYFDEKVEMVRSRTATLKPEDIPTVYYVRGPEALTTHGRNSYTAWLVEMAGGDLVTKNSEKELLITATMEEVVKWDPEYVFMGRVDNVDLVTKDPAWSTIRAVKENKVFVNPKGVMYWDYSSENVLLMEFIAKTLHPDLFEDIDIIVEIKDYYQRFYGCSLTEDQARRIYEYQKPVQ